MVPFASTDMVSYSQGYGHKN